MNLSCDKITEIFVLADEFCQEFNETVLKTFHRKSTQKKA